MAWSVSHTSACLLVPGQSGSPYFRPRPRLNSRSRTRQSNGSAGPRALTRSDDVVPVRVEPARVGDTVPFECMSLCEAFALKGRIWQHQ